MLPIWLRPRVIVAILLMAGAAVAQPPESATRTQARTLGYAGVAAYQAGDYATAHEKLENAYQLFPIPSLGLWSARALVRTGRWVEAAERYHQVASLPLEAGNAAVQQTAQKDSEREVSELLPRIPSVTLQLVGAAAGEVELTMDGQALDATVLDEPLLLNPGEHRAEARRGEQRSAASVSLVAGQHENIVLAFRVAPRPAEAAPFVAPMAPGPLQGERAGVDANADARHAWRTVGWVSLGLGAAGIATGVAAYFIGDARYDKLQEDPSCSKNSCGPSAEDDVEGYDPIRTVHLVGLIAGGVLTATGITLLLVTGEPEMDVALRLGPGSATLATTF